jgi:transposase
VQHSHLRGLLYEAAIVILTRTSAESALRTWGLRLREKIGFKRAAVAVARKLAVVMHAMLRSGQLFDRTAGGGSLRPVLTQGVHSRTPN